LYAGTETGIYVSYDDGGGWQSLQLNLPRASVRDIAVHGADVIVATHGRAFWVLDDVSPLRQLTDQIRGERMHLFAPQPAVRWAGGRTREPGAAGENPFPGVAVTYSFKQKPSGPVTLTFFDSAGAELRTFATDTAKPRAGEQDSAFYAPGDSMVPARPGSNRFVWNLRRRNASKVKDVVIDAGMVEGPVVVPGRYAVRLSADGQNVTQQFTVTADPRVAVTPADLLAQYALALQIQMRIDTLAAAVGRIEQDEAQLKSWGEWSKGQPYATRVGAAADPLHVRLEAVRDALTEVHSHEDESTLAYPIRIYNKLLTLNAMVQSADAAPTRQERDVFQDLAAALDGELATLRALETGELAAFNRLIHELNIPPVGTPAEGAKP